MSALPTYTYLATRTHPDAGVLLKVGISNDPERRARELGATLHGPLLPERCEAELHRYLKRKRVWSGLFPLYCFQPDPVFPAKTEWFYTDVVLGDWLRTYIVFARETEGLLL